MLFQNMDRIVFAGDSVTDMGSVNPVGEGLFDNLGHKMREHTPTADASVQQSRHPASEIHEKPQAVHHAQVNRSVRELETSVREKPAGKARPAEQRSLGQSPASTEPSAPATAPTV